ncbi:Hypothetical predicted protein [Cloeon dipterum]|uniref:Probable arginine--tRNA ligase, mitochondrial n=1 Tax=Cloeon dipterum TaxID=197152 RepID=A0A8S1CWC3_9INSE|nr:Hypothetical predicted protein [Cloeon dipterum]
MVKLQVWEVLRHLDASAVGSKRTTLKFNKVNQNIELHFPVSSSADICALQKIPGSEVCHQGKSAKAVVTLDKTQFVPEVVNSVISKPKSFWIDSPFCSDIKRQKVLVEFSSPNIAKPFHMGHLRSTIIGNYVSNLMSSLGHDVHRINYLGDWGTQFGLLNVGLELGQVSDEQIAANPIQVLYESYVLANREAEKDPGILSRARQIFKQMEDGDFAETERWEKFRQYTISELKQTYHRLGVVFDEYQWESMFGAKDISSVIAELEGMNLLNDNPDGKRVVKVGNRNVTLVKSDGSTLYLTRDVAAAKHRFQQHKFDQLLYVVENGQGDHFIALKHILKGLDHPWSDGITHIKFGRIHGMSTRRGQAVFLKDILDEARERSTIRQNISKNTRVGSDDKSAEVLGVSAVIINDLKQRRQKDYTFDWEKALQMQGDSGSRLQYTHCRLCSLRENSGARPADECNATLLTESQATALVTEIARFDEILRASYLELESCILVQYLFSLCNHINQAFQHLTVKGQPPEIASQRMLLFTAAKIVLSEGLEILGIEPLEKM